MRARHGTRTGEMRSAYKIVVCELQQKSKEDKKTLSAVIWFQKGKLQDTVHFVTVDISVFFSSLLYFG